MRGTFDIAIDVTHEVLRERLARAVADHTGPHLSRGDHAESDIFLASTARHLAAVSAALLPEVRRRLPDGGTRARVFIHQCRRLEVALGQMKAKLYGEAHAIHRGWAAVWQDVGTELDRTLVLERALVDGLLDVLDADQADELAAGLYHAELRSPTRPHPWLPHQGVQGRVARRLASTVDHFWDATEGRMVPAPPAHHLHHERDGLLVRYLLADPVIDEPPLTAADRE